MARKRNQRTFFRLAAVVGTILLTLVVLASAYIVRTRSQAPTASQASMGSGANLTDYWNGTAEWQLEKIISQEANPTWNGGFTTHATIVPAGDTWYLVSRTISENNDGCPYKLGTEIRRSDDRGKTFSPAVPLVTPENNTPWECAVTDGSLYYSSEQDKWIYLTQCLARSGGWSGCLFEKSGASPMGGFSPVAGNPVIKNGELWNKICGEGKTCSKITRGGGIGDEGTFDIIEYRDGFYYVSFHGFSNPYGFRGLAKTKNFKNWILNDKDLPNDAYLSKDDVKNWRENWINGESIGVGHVNTIKQDGYYYSVVEAADMNLLCTSGQNWNLGLVRSKNINHRRIEQLPMGNPFYYSSKNNANQSESLPCNVQYPKIFKDSSGTYLSVLRFSDVAKNHGLHIYKLTATNNALNNGNLWKCTAENWQRITSDSNITNLAVYRNPEQSSDGNCFLATNCGSGSCSIGNSIYQDFPNTKRQATTAKFGMRLRTSSGAVGSGRMVLWELDPVLKAHEVVISDLSGEYKLYEQTVQINPETKNLRIEFYLNDPVESVGDYQMDEAFATLSR